MTTCPTCRVPYPPPDQAITNTFAGQLIDKYPGHKCKFSEYGCGVKMTLSDIVEHERTCAERTVKCPHLRCGLIIQMKHFYDLNKHRDNGSKCMFQYINNKNLPMKENDTMMKFSLLSFNPLLKHKQNFSFRILEVYGKKFYVNLLYLPPPRSSFVVTVFLAENEEVSQKYFVNMNISKDTLKYQRNVLSYEGPVLSIDNMDKRGNWIGDDEETIDQSWCFHFEAARPFLEVADERGDNNRIRTHFPMRINVGCVL